MAKAPDRSATTAEAEVTSAATAPTGGQFKGRAERKEEAEEATAVAKVTNEAREVREDMEAQMLPEQRMR